MRTLRFSDPNMSHLLCDAVMMTVGALFSVVFVQVSPDAAALAGACIAAVIAVNDARRTEKDRFTLACVILASVSSGLFLPGGVLFTWYPDTAAKLTYHVWVLLGIVFGLLGWALIAAIFSFRDLLLRRKDRIAREAANRLGLPSDDGK